MEKKEKEPLKPIFPGGEIVLFEKEYRTEEKLGNNPHSVYLWINRSEESMKAVEVMERWGIAYIITHSEREEPILSSTRLIDIIPLPALHLAFDRWLATLANIKYFIGEIKPVIIDEIREEERERIQKVMLEIRKEAEEEYGTESFRYGSYIPR